MILLFRKYLVRIMLFFSLITLFLAIAAYILNIRFNLTDFSSSTGQIWWLNYNRNSKINSFHIWLIVTACTLYSLAVGFIVARQIKKNPSPQLAFLYLFIFSFSLYIFRLYYIVPQINWLHIDDETISRVLYFGRFLGLTAFFAASLFCAGLQIQKFGYILLITVLASFTLSIIIPFNTTEVTTALFYRIAEEKSIALFCLVLEVLTVMNYLSAAIKQSRGELYRLILFCIMVLCGYELLFFLNPPFMIPGLMLLFTGTILYIRTNQKLFLLS